MRIAGIYPQKIERDWKIQHAVNEPYGLEMILAIAKQEGHDVELFIPAEEIKGKIEPVNEEKFVEKIIDYKPNVAAFSLYTCQYPAGKRIASEIKKRRLDIVTVAGNRYPTYLKEGIEEPFDFFVIKEGEETFKELLREIENEQRYENVKGLAFRKNGKEFFTGVRERNFNLDSLPNALRFPIILNQVYKGISIPSLSKNPHYAIIESSRCCYNNCKFCDNENVWGNKVTFRSPRRVVDEMFDLKKKGVDIFYFMDLNFTAFPGKAKELCKEMLRRKLNASWYCMSNIATLDGKKDLLDLMKKAGCYKIAWGIESTNDNSLELMDKRVGNEFTTNEQTIRVLQSSLETGLINQGYYIIGFPWETSYSILKDAEALRYMPLHQLNIGIFTPVPMSKFYKDMLEGEVKTRIYKVCKEVRNMSNGNPKVHKGLKHLTCNIYRWTREIIEGYELDPDLEKHDRNTLIYNHKILNNETIKALQNKIYNDFYNSIEYTERINDTCCIEPKFTNSFNDYFEFLGKSLRINIGRLTKVA